MRSQSHKDNAYSRLTSYALFFIVSLGLLLPCTSVVGKASKSASSPKQKQSTTRAVPAPNSLALLNRRRHKHRVHPPDSSNREIDAKPLKKTAVLSKKRKTNLIPKDSKKRRKVKHSQSFAKLQRLVDDVFDSLLENKDVLPAILW